MELGTSCVNILSKIYFEAVPSSNIRYTFTNSFFVGIHIQMSFKYLSNCLKPVSETASKTLSCSKKNAFPKRPSEFMSGITLKSRNQYGWMSRGWRAYATKTSTSTPVPEPSKEQLRLVVLQATIPFIGFGFMDNALLIIAGDAIDSTICLAFGFSTMCAAAIGNIISDLAGVGLGAVIEDYAAKLNLPVAKLSHVQRQLRSVRFHTQFGNALGLTIGCIIGMCPLLWIDSTEIERRKRLEAIDSLCRDVVVEAKGLLECESTCLYLLVEEEVAEEKPWNMSKDEQASYLSKSKQEILSGLHDMHKSTEHRRIKKEFRAKYADSNLYNTKEPIVIPFGSGIQSIAAVRRKPLVVRQ